MNSLWSHCRDTLKGFGGFIDAPYLEVTQPMLVSSSAANTLLPNSAVQLIAFKMFFDANERHAFRLFSHAVELEGKHIPKDLFNGSEETEKTAIKKCPPLPTDVWVHTLSFLQPNLNSKNVASSLNGMTKTFDTIKHSS